MLGFLGIIGKTIEIGKSLSMVGSIMKTVEKSGDSSKKIEEINADQKKFKNVGVAQLRNTIEINYKGNVIKFNQKSRRLNIDIGL